MSGGAYEGGPPFGRPNPLASSSTSQPPQSGFPPHPQDRPLRPLPHAINTISPSQLPPHPLQTQQPQPSQLPVASGRTFRSNSRSSPSTSLNSRHPVPPPINVVGFDMAFPYGAGGTSSVPSGMMRTGPSISLAEDDMWATGLQVSPAEYSMPIQPTSQPLQPPRRRLSEQQHQSSYMGPLVSPSSIPLSSRLPRSMGSPLNDVLDLQPTNMALVQTPTSAGSSIGMFDPNLQQAGLANVVRAYFPPDPAVPDIASTSGTSRPSSANLMVDQFGQMMSGEIPDERVSAAKAGIMDTGDGVGPWPGGVEDGGDGGDGEDFYLEGAGYEEEYGGMEDDEEIDADGRPRKRPRNSLKRGTACVRCRTKKLKCTGERPVCSVCQNNRKPVECVYQPMAKRKPKTQRLRSRLQELEDQIKEKETRLTQLVESTSTTPTSTRSKLKVISEEPDTESTPSQPVDAPFRRASAPDFQASHEPTQGFGFHDAANVPYPSINQMNMGTSQFQVVAQNGQTISVANPNAMGFVPGVGLDDGTVPYTEWTATQPVGYPLDLQAEMRALGVSSMQTNTPASVPLNTGMQDQGLTFEPGNVTVAAGSNVEYALIYLILPYSSWFSMPVEPQRFLDSLAPTSANRPHPALLYALFAAAVYVLKNDMKPFPGAKAIPSKYRKPEVSLYSSLKDLGNSFHDRAKLEMEQGMLAADRFEELAKACAGMTRYLVLMGKPVEASMLPICRLAVACGLHRIESTNLATSTPRLSTTVPPSTTSGSGEAVTQVAAETEKFRPKLVVVPPVDDRKTLWERIETFWAIKALDWGIGLLYGWPCGLAESEVSTVWPKSYDAFMFSDTRRSSETALPKSSSTGPSKRALPEVRVLALQSLSLVNNANRLFDLPKPSITSLQTQPTETTQYHPYAQYSLKKLQASLETFRTSLPDSESRPNDVSTDPWWIFTRANLAAADMLFFAEYAVYQPIMFEHALNAAKRMVELVEGIHTETYAHLARFLYREANRAAQANSDRPSPNAIEADANKLLQALEEKAGRWHPFGLHLGEDLRRLKQGLGTRPGLYPRSK